MLFVKIDKNNKNLRNTYTRLQWRRQFYSLYKILPMNEYIPIFQFLNVIVKNYSNLSVQKLLCQNLQIQIILPISSQMLCSTSSFKKFQISFLKEIKNFACFIVSHPENMRLSSMIQEKIFEKVSSCIIIDSEFNQWNNLLLTKIPEVKMNQKAYFVELRKPFKDKMKKQLQDQLQLYLTLVQIFHSHINLKVCMYSVKDLSLLELLQDKWNFDRGKDDDELFDFLENDDYLRILEQRASKISIQQLTEMYQVRTKNWGQIINIGNGSQYLIVWITVDRFPCMKRIPSKRRKNLLQIQSHSLGYSVYKWNSKSKQTLNESDFESYTTVIMNFSAEFTQNIPTILEEELEGIFEEFKKKDRINRIDKKFKEDLKNIERISSILQIDPAIMFNNLFIKKI